MIATDTDQKEEQMEYAYVSRKRMWRTLPEPSSACIVFCMAFMTLESLIVCRSPELGISSCVSRPFIQASHMTWRCHLVSLPGRSIT